MFNYQVAFVLNHAKQQNKWVYAKDLVKYGLFSGNINYMMEKKQVITRTDKKGTAIKLTVEGYYDTLRILGYNAY